MVSTTPLTDLLQSYRLLRKPGHRGLSAHLSEVRQFSKDPAGLAGLVERSMKQFARYSNPKQFFHAGEISAECTNLADSPVPGACAPLGGPPPEKIERTIDFAQWASRLDVCEVAALPELAFEYIDRELDCLRTSPGQLFEDGTPSKRALVLDLLLNNKVDATPILAELKIRADEDAFYALIQCLCAAVHLISQPQRERLRSVYGLTSLNKDCGPYLDLYIIFVEPRKTGEWPVVLGETIKLCDQLLKQPVVAGIIRRIEFLEATLTDNMLEFARAEPREPSAGKSLVDVGNNYRENERARFVLCNGPALYKPFRDGILAYFRRHEISWWGGGDGPTENPISSQVACINHLEPVRLSSELALNLARKHVADAIEVLPIEGGFVAYEWVGECNYLNEFRWSPTSRGRNVTSLDAVMAVKRESGMVCILVIEWKYTECYDYGVSLAVSKRGTPRLETYRPLLEHVNSPILPGQHERLFFDPIYQLMRQVLLAWQMVEHREFGATEWLHLHVVPSANKELLGRVTSPKLAHFQDLASAWRSVLKRPERYHLVTPESMTPDISINGENGPWRGWLRGRYGT